MALIKCKECGKEISSKASVCPNCGVKVHPLKHILVISITIVIFIASVFFIRKVYKTIQNKEINTLIGTYVLTNNTFNKLNDKNIFLDKYNIKKTIIINKDNIIKTNGIELCQNEFKLVKMENNYYLITGFHMLAPYEDGHTDLDYIVCFNNENDKLKQIDCPNNNYPAHSLPNIGLEYSKK